jgi:hypothetical protein
MGKGKRGKLRNIPMLYQRTQYCSVIGIPLWLLLVHA